LLSWPRKSPPFVEPEGRFITVFTRAR